MQAYNKTKSKKGKIFRDVLTSKKTSTTIDVQKNDTTQHIPKDENDVTQNKKGGKDREAEKEDGIEQEDFTEVPLVLIHGFKGSHLVDTSKKRVYVSHTMAAGISTPCIALPMEWEENEIDGKEKDEQDEAEEPEDETKEKEGKRGKTKKKKKKKKQGKKGTAGTTGNASSLPRQAKDSLEPERPIAAVFGVKVYSPFMKMVRTTGRPFYPFAYDWRRDNNENSLVFERFLDEVVQKELTRRKQQIDKENVEKEKTKTKKKKTGKGKKVADEDVEDDGESQEIEKKKKKKKRREGKASKEDDTTSAAKETVKIQVVAHSNGGLLTLSVIHRRPELFHSVLFAGVPFGGGIGFMPDLHLGTSLGLNKRLLSPNVLFTFPTSFTFFSLDPNDCGLFTSDGVPIESDLYSIDEWKKHRLSLFAPPETKAQRKRRARRKGKEIEKGNSIKETEEEADCSNEEDDDDASDNDALPSLEPAHERHLDHALKLARRFKQSLEFRKDIAYPPLAVIMGEGRMTLNKMVRDGPKSVRGWDFVSASRGDGDGRVTLEKAVPSEGIPHTPYTSKFEHSSLLCDLETVSVAIRDLFRQVAAQQEQNTST